MTITVTDVNDNAPEFQNTPYSLTYTDDSLTQANRANIPVLIVLAADADAGANADVTYSIDLVSQFASTTELTITATDGGDVPMSSTVVATISFESLCREQEYSIDSDSGVVTAMLLCDITISTPSSDVVINSQIILNCNVVRVTNDPVQVEFLREGSVISGPVLPVGQEFVVYIDNDASLADMGQYNCRASTNIGTIQTATPVNINILSKL